MFQPGESCRPPFWRRDRGRVLYGGQRVVPEDTVAGHALERGDAWVDVDDLDPREALSGDRGLAGDDGKDLLGPEGRPEAPWAPGAAAHGHTDRRLVAGQAEDPDLHVAIDNEALDRGESESRGSMPGGFRLDAPVVAAAR